MAVRPLVWAPKARQDLLRIWGYYSRLASPEISPLTIITTLVMNVIVFSLFAMIGGILMVAFLQKQAAKARVG